MQGPSCGSMPRNTSTACVSEAFRPGSWLRGETSGSSTAAVSPPARPENASARREAHPGRGQARVAGQGQRVPVRRRPVPRDRQPDRCALGGRAAPRPANRVAPPAQGCAGSRGRRPQEVPSGRAASPRARLREWACLRATPAATSRHRKQRPDGCLRARARYRLPAKSSPASAWGTELLVCWEAGPATVGEGAVWAMSDPESTLLRIDPARNAVVARIPDVLHPGRRRPPATAPSG